LRDVPVKIPKADTGATKLFEELTPSRSEVTSKKMFGQPAAFASGNLFMGVYGESVFVRLSESDRSEARSRTGFAPFEPMPGRVMVAYWVLPASVLRDRAEARRWVAKSLAYALTLPPKTRTGKKGDQEHRAPV
jgi:TfoX/Sxy family transcriptional regulator of competence genes